MPLRNLLSACLLLPLLAWGDPLLLVELDSRSECSRIPEAVRFACLEATGSKIPFRYAVLSEPGHCGLLRDPSAQLPCRTALETSGPVIVVGSEIDTILPPIPFHLVDSASIERQSAAMKSARVALLALAIAIPADLLLLFLIFRL